MTTADVLRILLLVLQLGFLAILYLLLFGFGDDVMTTSGLNSRMASAARRMSASPSS